MQNKKLNNIRKSDFTFFNEYKPYIYKNAIIHISYDYLNNRYYYSSNTHAISGWVSTLDYLKSKIKFEYSKLEENYAEN